MTLSSVAGVEEENSLDRETCIFVVRAESEHGKGLLLFLLFQANEEAKRQQQPIKVKTNDVMMWMLNLYNNQTKRWRSLLAACTRAFRLTLLGMLRHHFLSNVERRTSKDGS